MDKKVWIIGVVLVFVVILVLTGWKDGITGEAKGGGKGKCTPSAEICDGKDNDCDVQVDEGLPIACSSASTCGQSGWIGDPRCGSDGNVHKDYTTYQCNFPGTCSSLCSSQAADYVYDYCKAGCSNGQCLPYINTTG